MNVKIIKADNYNRELLNDELIVENLDKEKGEKIVDELNKLNRDDEIYYQLVKDDYELFVRDY